MPALALETFAHLSDDAIVRIVPVERGLTRVEALPALAVLEEMGNLWVSRGTARAAASDLVADGHFLMLAYEPNHGDLSGCTKDSVTHALAHFEQQLGTRMLNAPRMAVRLRDRVQFLTQGEFKAKRAAGEITDSTQVYDHLLERLGDVRAGRFETTVAESWYDRVGKPKA